MIKPEVKILLVDDRQDNLFSLKTLLEKDGYDIVLASSGQQALKVLLKETDFTLILMDVQMPGLNGFETASLIYEREKLRHIPVIFVTAQDYSEEFIFEGYKAGAIDYIYKPINSDLLRAKVSVFADLYRKNHLLRLQEKELQRINLELEERVKERTQELSDKNRELQNMNLELKKVNLDLDNFVYSASHDLKAPVSNIEGLLEALREILDAQPEKDPAIEGIYTLINQSIVRFKNTIEDLTEVTEIQKNMDEDNNCVDILEVIEDVKVSIRDLIEQNCASVNINCEGVKEILFSKKNLNSVVYNLISNAIKYRSPERKPEVNVKIYSEKDKVYLIVSDNGLGFDPGDKLKIFGMFKRLHNHVEGTGIGLYLVKRIIENSGGCIDAESVPGAGSVFKVCFNNKKALAILS